MKELPAIQTWTNYLFQKRRQERSVAVFSKVLILFTLAKLLSLWSVASVVLPFTRPSHITSFIPSVLFFPSVYTAENSTVFFLTASIALVLCVFIRPNYLTNLLIFWIALNLFRIRYPMTNGSDYLLFVLSAYAVPLSLMNFSNTVIQMINVALYNFILLLVKIQIVLVYLVSGWDKLLSEVWRNGKAMQYVPHLTSISNSMIMPKTIETPLALALCWITIFFELAFVFLVWKKRTRLGILCVGVTFHLVIGIFLSLPDFATIMIASYLFFIEDEDWSSVFFFKRQPL